MATPGSPPQRRGLLQDLQRTFTDRAGGCVRCGQRTKLLHRYCPECEPFARRILDQYSAAARQILAVSGPLGQEWVDLHSWLYGARVPREDALASIADAAVDWMHRYVTAARSDGIITDDELATFHRAAELLGLDHRIVEPLAAQLQRERMLGDIRSGNLPTVSLPDLHLPLDEYCYQAVGATRWRDLQSGPQPTPGQLIVTNRKIRFIAHQHGGEIPLSKVQRVMWHDSSTITIEATTRSLSGRFSVPDPEYTTLIVDAALRIDRRILLPGQDGNGSRHVPQHVKSAVFQRDRGRCQECGAQEYLEFDHMIPFSLGGASSEDNVQLLCRACNLKKGARI